MELLKNYFSFGSGEWWTNRGYGNAIPTLMGWQGTAHSSAQELQVRGMANNAFALSVAIPGNIWTSRSVVALCRQHVSAPTMSSPRWGRSWQSPLWAAHMGLAAMVGWNGLPYENDRDAIKRVLLDEANYVCDSRPPLFWKDAQGVELRPGDSAAEENSWCATVLWVAAALMPTAPRAAEYLQTASDLCVSAFASPGNDPRGSNVTSNYLVVNHNRVHPDYMTTVSQNFWGVVAHKLVGRDVPMDCLYALGPVPSVYEALIYSDLDEKGTRAYSPTSPRINFPAIGNDWGARRPAAYAALDGLVARAAIHEEANFYASIHLADVASMQLRVTTTTHPLGSFVDRSVVPPESTYAEENSYVASQVAFLALAEQVM